MENLKIIWNKSQMTATPHTRCASAGGFDLKKYQKIAWPNKNLTI
jgi:hypothetical protein